MDCCVEGPKQKAGILPELRLSIPPLRDHGVIQHQQKKKSPSCESKVCYYRSTSSTSCYVFSFLLIIGGPACWCVAMFAHEQAAK